MNEYTMRDRDGAMARCPKEHPHQGRHMGWGRETTEGPKCAVCGRTEPDHADLIHGFQA